MVSLLVIVPFRGLVEHLEETVASIRTSKGISLRILVFDDRDEEVSRPEFLNELEYIYTGGIGLPQVINLSKKYVRENYVTVVAGDDLVLPEKFNLQLERMQMQKTEISITRMQKFSKNRSYIPSLSGECNVELFSKVLLLFGPYGADGSIIVSNTFYQERYILDLNDSFSDWAMALSEYPVNIAYINKRLLLYRQHENQVTRKRRNDFSQSTVMAAWRKTFRELIENSNVTDETIYVISAPWYRIRISKIALENSALVMSKILKKYRDLNPSRRDLHFVEAIILRRIIFRINPSSPLLLFSMLTKLGMRFSLLKFLFVLSQVLFDRIRAFPNRPRVL